MKTPSALRRKDLRASPIQACRAIMPAPVVLERPVPVVATDRRWFIELQLNPPAWTPAVETFTAPPAGSGGAVCALAPEGLRWRYVPGGIIWGTPALADLNARGNAHILVASIEPGDGGDSIGVLTVLSREGHCLRRLAFDAAVECSPVVADVDGNGKLDVLVADQAGMLHCYETRGFGPVEWGLFGGDSHNTRNAANAYAYGQTPHGFQWRWRPQF